MKIQAIMENTACRDDLTAEHGLSLYIETAKHKILFDAGQSGAFADNAEKMGIDLSKVDTAILSHGHYDHGGGLMRFMEINKTAPIYMNEHAFEGHYHGTERYIGLDAELKKSGRIIFAGEELIIDEELTLYACNDRQLAVPIDSSGLTAEKPCGGSNTTMMPEDFRHEQYLMITAGEERKVLISGCSHKGILNIVNWFKPDILVGGFHFMNIDTEDAEGKARLSHAAKQLSAYDTKYCTCHCTGLSQYAYLKTLMGEKLAYLSCGQSIEI